MFVFYAMFISFLVLIFKYLIKISNSYFGGFTAVSDLLLRQMGQLRLLLICSLDSVPFILFGQLVSGHFILSLNILVQFNLLIITLYHMLKDPYKAPVLSTCKLNITENTGGFLCLKIFLRDSIQKNAVTICT